MILSGHLIFDPLEVTKKHENQSSWKKVALIQFDDEYDAVWRWYLKKRFNLKLNKPLRGSHVTVVNDRFTDLTLWNSLKNEINNKPVKLEITNDLGTNGEHWWLEIGDTSILDEIRSKLKLDKPFYPYHYTLGLVNDLEHSNYIKRILCNYNTECTG